MAEDFGRALKAIRQQHGWRQQDLASALGGGFARSTLANVEAGRERPSARLWEALQQLLPDRAAELAALYEQARVAPRARVVDRHVDGGPETLGGPFAIEHIRYVYVFRESRSPEEIIEVRRVRSLRHGADGFGLKFTNSQSAEFQSEAEPLWGGAITEHERITAARRTVYLSRFTFPRALARGEAHEFALRSWVERDPEPSNQVIFDLTVPTEVVTIQLNFHGVRPRVVYRMSPSPDEFARPAEASRQLVGPLGDGVWTVDFRRPSLGYHYGVEWVW